jgi:pimeloyl-ACP methyl ester carboxylesterase
MTDDMARLAVNGVELAWREQGSGPGPTLVLLHGYTGSSHDFSLHVDALAEHRRVVVLDQRGHGRSTKLGDVSGYSMELLVQDLIAFIDAVGDGPVDLLGHSMGGMVSFGAVLERPDLIDSLILMDTSAWSFLPENEEIRQLVMDFMAGFDPARGVPSTLSMGGPEEALIEAATPAEWRAEKDAIFAGMDAYAIKALGSAILGSDGVTSVRDRLGEITCVTTVLVGEHDHPLVDQAPEVAARVGQGHLNVIAGAYHSPQLTHAAQWRAGVEAHLDRAHEAAHAHD